MHPVQTVTQGLELWFEIYHAEEESTQDIIAEHMINGLEECRNLAVQQTLPISISDVEAHYAK